MKINKRSKRKNEKQRKKSLKRKRKGKRKKNAWLQAWFLGDAGVIWCISLGDSHFQTYVIDNVEIVLIFYLHITCEYLIHLLVAHTTSKSLLNSIHMIGC